MNYSATYCSRIAENRFPGLETTPTGNVDTIAAITRYLESPELSPAPVVRTDQRSIILDLSIGSMALGESLLNLPVERFGQRVNQALADAGTEFAFGRWGEPRELYVSSLFANESTELQEPRVVHLGVDVFCLADTPIYAPLAGRIHIKTNNAAELDYGPLLVLDHETSTGEIFFSLYGHLRAASLDEVHEGQAVSAGEQIATVGSAPENGNWPPHLHFQLILDLLGLGADFPGVARRSEQAAWLALSPLPGRFFPECNPEHLDGRAE